MERLRLKRMINKYITYLNVDNHEKIIVEITH